MGAAPAGTLIRHGSAVPPSPWEGKGRGRQRFSSMAIRNPARNRASDSNECSRFRSLIRSSRSSLPPLVQQGEETLFLAVCVVQGGFVFRLQQEQGLFQVVLGIGKEDFHYFGHKYQLQISVNFLRVLL